MGDTGLTGRKIIVGTPTVVWDVNGGGAFSGKRCHQSRSFPPATWRDTSPRTSSLPALADRAEVQLAYAIGVAEPVQRFWLTTFGTGKVAEEKIENLVREKLPPHAEGNHRNLEPAPPPSIRRTAAYGHFGRNDPDFTWEATDKAATLRQKAGVGV